MATNPDGINKKKDGASGEKGNANQVSGIERREFLKLGASGVIVSVAAGCAATLSDGS